MKKIAVGLVLFALVARADNWYVAPWGDDTKDGKSWATAMKSPEVVVADWGVTIRRLNASRRLSGNTADAGCTEFYTPKGSCVYVR